MKNRNIIFFTNGSIGDFLMVMYFGKIIQSDSYKIHIITPRNKKIFEELSSKYDFVIHEVNIKNFLSILNLFNFITTRNTIITPATVLPLHTKLLAWSVSLFFDSKLVGIDDGNRVNRFLYDEFYNFDSSKSYVDGVCDTARQLKFDIRNTEPVLDFDRDDSVLEKFALVRDSYIVLHICGSHIKRSYTKEEIGIIISSIKIKYLDMKIVLTGSKEDFLYIEENTIEKKNIINIVGKVSMEELVSIIHNSYLYIGVDTGTTHIACLMNKKCFVTSHEASLCHWMPSYNTKATIVSRTDEIGDLVKPDIKVLESSLRIFLDRE